MFSIFRRTNLERKRIRWADTKKTWATFFIVLCVVIFFATLLGLFTWGISAWFSLYE